MSDISANPPAGKIRWTIVALLFFATTINYIDRQVLGILAPFLQKEIGWSEKEYGFIVMSFQAAYAIGLLVMGWFVDKFGTRLGYSVAIIIWSLAAMFHAGVRNVAGFALARFSLGIGEGGNFPASIKTIADWFPKNERALANGICVSGTNIGAVLAPLIVPVLALNYGWQYAFIITGALGFIWLIFWLIFYREPEKHPSLTAEELAYIRNGQEVDGEKIPFYKQLRLRETWAIAFGRMITDPVWWFYLYWGTKFLNKTFHLDLAGVSGPLATIYLISDTGSIAGGWFSSYLIKKGIAINKARKLAILLCALCVVPVIFVPYVGNLWIAVLLIGLAGAGHQGWAANIFTVVSDVFPKNAVASQVGIGGMAGSVGGIFAALGIGYYLQATNDYASIFLVGGFMYLLALLVLHLFVPEKNRLVN